MSYLARPSEGFVYFHLYSKCVNNEGSSEKYSLCVNREGSSKNTWCEGLVELSLVRTCKLMSWLIYSKYMGSTFNYKILSVSLRQFYRGKLQQDPIKLLRQTSYIFVIRHLPCTFCI